MNFKGLYFKYSPQAGKAVLPNEAAEVRTAPAPGYKQWKVQYTKVLTYQLFALAPISCAPLETTEADHKTKNL